jgi:hypothetical protein
MNMGWLLGTAAPSFTAVQRPSFAKSALVSWLLACAASGCAADTGADESSPESGDDPSDDGSTETGPGSDGNTEATGDGDGDGGSETSGDEDGSTTSDDGDTGLQPGACEHFTAIAAVGQASSAYALGIADANGDGVDDIFGSAVDIFLSDGSGDFGAPISLPISQVPFSEFAFGDLNGDEHLDFVTNTSTPDGFAVALGDGSGSFSLSQVPLPDSLSTPTFLPTLVDWNGDGNLDILGRPLCCVAENDEGDRVQVFHGDGMGDFTYAGAIPLTGGSAGARFAVGDFNGDDWPDLVAEAAGSSLDIILGDGTLTPAATTTYDAPDLPYDFVVADFTGDDVQDIVLFDRLRLMVGDGSGAFGDPGEANYDDSCSGAEAVDVDDDGKLDLLAVCGGKAYVYLSDGAGGFTLDCEFEFSGVNLDRLAVGDFNADGQVDFASLAGFTTLGYALGI